MQRILEIEHGGIAESLTNLYRLTWDESYLRTAERFYHAAGLRSAGPRPGRPARPAREHQHPEDDRLPADLGGDRGPPLPRHRRELLADRARSSHLRHRRDQQLGALARAGRDRGPAEQPHLRELLQLQHAEADPAAAFPPAAAGGPARLLRAHAVQPDAGRAGPAVRARLQHLLHRAVTGRLQAPATLHGQRPGRLFDELPQLLLRSRERDGDPGEIRRHHLLPGHPRAVRELVHPVRGPLDRGRADDPAVRPGSRTSPPPT